MSRWLVDRAVTAVSTVPTLAALSPVEALWRGGPLIFRGEACPPELAARLAAHGREMWNTNWPTEATIVPCGAPPQPREPVRIGLTLHGSQQGMGARRAIRCAAAKPASRSSRARIWTG